MVAWVFQAVCNFFNSIINAFFGVFAFGFLRPINIDYGYPDNLMSQIFGSAGGGGLIGRGYGVEMFMSWFVTIGTILAVLILVYKILLMMNPFEPPEEGPFALVGRFIAAVVLCRFSYQLIMWVESIFQIFFSGMKDKAMTLYYSTPFGSSLLDYLDDTGVAQNMIAGEWFTGPDNISGYGAASEIVALGSPIVTIVGALVVFFCGVSLLTNMVKLIAEIIERYVVGGVLFYLSPIAFGLIASKGTMSMFANYIKMMLSQYMILILNIFFMVGFFWGLSHSPNLAEMTDANISNAFSATSSPMLMLVLYTMMLCAWLKAAQHIDEFLRGLGMSTAQTGRASGMGGAAAAFLLGGAAKNFVGGFGRGFAGVGAAAGEGPTGLGSRFLSGVRNGFSSAMGARGFTPGKASGSGVMDGVKKAANAEEFASAFNNGGTHHKVDARDINNHGVDSKTGVGSYATDDDSNFMFANASKTKGMAEVGGMAVGSDGKDWASSGTQEVAKHIGASNDNPLDVDKGLFTDTKKQFGKDSAITPSGKGHQFAAGMYDVKNNDGAFQQSSSKITDASLYNPKPLPTSAANTDAGAQYINKGTLGGGLGKDSFGRIPDGATDFSGSATDSGAKFYEWKDRNGESWTTVGAADVNPDYVRANQSSFQNRDIVRSDMTATGESVFHINTSTGHGSAISKGSVDSLSRNHNEWQYGFDLTAGVRPVSAVQGQRG